MKAQVWFETNLGYAATKDRLLDSRDFIGDSSGDYCGRLTFRFKSLKDFTLQITTKSKIGITYPENSDYRIVLERLKPFLVKPDGSTAEILRIIKKGRVNTYYVNSPEVSIPEPQDQIPSSYGPVQPQPVNLSYPTTVNQTQYPPQSYLPKEPQIQNPNITQPRLPPMNSEQVNMNNSKRISQSQE